MQNRNKAEKRRKRYREDELQLLNIQAAFKARMADDLKDVNFVLSDYNIKGVVVHVEDDKIAEFSR